MDSSFMPPASGFRDKWAAWLLMAAVGVLPIALMSHQRLPSAMFHLALVAAIWLLWGKWAFAGRVWSENRGFFIGMLAPLVAALAGSIGHAEFMGSATERALRLFLGAFLLLAAFQAVGPVLLRRSLYGVCAAAVAAFGYIFYLAYPDFIRPETQVYNAVGYGNLTLLMGVLACFVGLGARDAGRTVAGHLLAWAGAGLGLAGFVLTQTRSGWLAVPVFVILGVLAYSGVGRSLAGMGRRLAWGLAILVAAGVVFMQAPGISERAEQAISEAQECVTQSGVSDTSICIRFQLWRASIAMWQEHPWFGVGANGGFEQQLQTVQLSRGVVSEYTAHNFGEAHNDLLNTLAVGGVFGLAGLLCIYFVPAWIFLRRLLASDSRETRMYAAMGAALCLGFFVFGWTELMFRGIRTLSFYTVMLALFMALSDAGRRAGDRPAAA